MVTARSITVETQLKSGDWERWVFTDIPTDGALFISLEAPRGDGAREWCELLGGSLVGELIKLGGHADGQPVKTKRPAAAATWSEFTHSVVGLAVEPNSGMVAMTQSYRDLLALGQTRGNLLPIVRRPESGAGELETFLPPELLKLNLDFVEDWHAEPDSITDHILALAGLTTPDRRVFISYRRAETSGLTEELHTALVKANFDVFLDTVDVPPAAPFQEVLLEELAHKAMVVILDSPDYASSIWCQEELRYAEQHELGLLVLRTPIYDLNGGERANYKAPVQPVIPASIIPVTDGDLEHPTANPADRRWQPKFLKKLVLEIKLEHQRALIQRKRQLQSNIVATFQKEGMTTEIGPDGIIRAYLQKKRNKVFYISSTPRRPELGEFQRCYLTCQNGAVLIALLASLRRHRRDTLDWISERANMKLYDMVEIPDMVRDLKARVR